MSIRIGWTVVPVAFLGLAVAPRLRAQGGVRDAGAPGVFVTGIAFDSLHDRPLVGAFVTLAAVGRPTTATTSDTSGRFHFEGVPAGQYTVGIRHAVFDSIGISGTSVRATVSDGRDTIRVSTPSFVRLWHVACGVSAPPRDSGFIFGTIRSAATHRPIANATVTVRWIAVEVDSTVGVSQHTWRADVRSDSAGEYRACSVPADAPLGIIATADAAPAHFASGEVDLAPNDYRVDRLDLLVGDSLRAGPASVSGVVTGGDGGPLAGARVRVYGGGETRTDTAGGFFIGALPAGSRELQVSSIGIEPVSKIVDLEPNDTVHLMLSATNRQALAPMRVFAQHDRIDIKQQFSERRALYAGEFLDSTKIARHKDLTSLLEHFGAHTQNGHVTDVFFFTADGTECRANLWIDGVRASMKQLAALTVNDLAAIEEYSRAATAPPDFIDRTSRSVCGALVIWTKRAFP